MKIEIRYTEQRKTERNESETVICWAIYSCLLGYLFLLLERFALCFALLLKLEWYNRYIGKRRLREMRQI